MQRCFGLELHHVLIAVVVFLFFLLVQQPPVGHGLLIHEVYRSHTTTHHSRQDSSGRVISPSQRPLPDNTQHSQQTDIHAPGGIRTHVRSRRAAPDVRLRPHSHWDRCYCLRLQQGLVLQRFVLRRFTFITPCRVGPNTHDLWCVAVATQASFLVRFQLFSGVPVFLLFSVLMQFF